MTVSITTVMAGIHQIHLGRTSATVIETGDGPVLVDLGWKWSYKKLKESLQVLGYHPADVLVAAVTHYHPDHSGGMRSFKQATEANLAVHRDEAKIYTSEAPIPPIMWGWRGAFGLFNPFLNILGRNPTPADILLEDNELLPVALEIRVIHTPGHTVGSVSFYVPSYRTLIVGDAMIYKGGKLYPPHNTFSYNSAIAFDSIRKLAQYNCSVVCFSHYPPLVGDAQNLVKELAVSLDR
jgi:glyoxylase-like metal-dependent hydrolase (beta-lactamase superfamily II)